jgi:uncharacterized RDD family membrane protein YckC
MVSLPGADADAIPAAPAGDGVPQPEAGVSEAGASDAGVSDAGVSYPGLITRTIAFVIDAALLELVAIVVGVGAFLILSLLHIPHELKTILVVIGSVVYVLWLVGYFVVFWSTTGQTPGARTMQIKVQTPEGDTISVRRAAIRCVGVLLAALPLFLGFVPILYDSRRRGFQDGFAGTVVVNAPAVSIMDARRAKKRAQYLASRGGPH